MDERIDALERELKYHRMVIESLIKLLQDIQDATSQWDWSEVEKWGK